MTEAIRILLAGPQTLFREALHCLLETERDFAVVGEVALGPETLGQVAKLRPDVLLLDMAQAPDAGIELLRALVRDRDPVHTVILTEGAGDNVVVSLKCGVRGIVPKRTTTPLLFKGIRAVAAGQYWVGHENILYLVNHIREDAPQARNGGARLTAREMEIVTSIVDGATNKEIAHKLSISEQTVKHHLTSVFGKVGVSNRLELALYAMHH